MRTMPLNRMLPEQAPAELTGRALLLRVLALGTALCWFIFSMQVLAQDHDNGLSLTALDRYVAEPDPAYQYRILDSVTGQGYTTYIIEMTSQRWLTEAEVNLPLWEHIMTMTVPDHVDSNIGFLYITGGSKSDAVPESATESDIRRALLTNTVVTTLYMVPNQPLTFIGDNNRARSEDAIIAYTWDKHFRSGDDKWPLRLPMTKSAVRAMDTVTALMADPELGAIEVNQFVVAGGSKRGWTTWTTAIVDKRVIAIIPVVIDLLNLSESFKHHYSVYGAYSLAVFDYVTSRNVNWIGTPEWDRLMALVEPYEYRDRLTLPKYLLNSTGDEFFLPDSWQFYWHDLVGEKHLRYVPNSNHSMGGTDVFDSVDAWYGAIVNNIAMPRYSWDVAEDGTITLFTLDEPSEVLLWRAHNPERRNFTQAQIGRAYESQSLSPEEPGVYRIKLEPPAQGYTAYYVEVHYPSGLELPFKFSTGVKIVPDVTEYEWQFLPESSRAP